MGHLLSAHRIYDYKLLENFCHRRIWNVVVVANNTETNSAIAS